MIYRIKYIVNIIIVFLLFAAIAIQRDGKAVGHDFTENKSVIAKSNEAVDMSTPIENYSLNGTREINTVVLGKDVIGYNGTTPIELHEKDGVIKKVVFLDNVESPNFFELLIEKELASKWEGMQLTEAANADIDVVSGATISSNAIIKNVQLAAQYGANVAPQAQTLKVNWKNILGILVVILGAIITLARIKDKRLITIQLILNVVVLGFWCGSFLSLTIFTSWAANGVNLSSSLVTFALFVVALLMPLFNRRGSYCHMHCPMGSAQELMHKIPVKRLKINPKANKILNKLRYYILMVLLLLMWCGVGFNLMDYELFSAFIIQAASTGILVLAGIFLILSIFIPRPYCRFVCPTGALLTISQQEMDKE